DFGMEPVGDTPAEFSALLQNERTRWHKLIKDLDIKLDRAIPPCPRRGGGRARLVSRGASHDPYFPCPSFRLPGGPFGARCRGGLPGEPPGGRVRSVRRRLPAGSARIRA